LAVAAPLTLVIINWNARAHLRRCLGAALPLGYPIIVVDNASSDGSRETVAEDFPSVTLITSDVNLGFAGGVNAGVRATASPWVLILNPDIEVTAAGIEQLVREGTADPTIGAAGACLVDGAGTPQAGFAVRRFPTLGTLAVDLLLVDQVWPGNP